MSSFQLMFPGVRNSLVFSSFGFKLLPLAFTLILTVASRLLHPNHINYKTSRLMEKRFSMVRDIQRGLLGEEKREEGYRGDQEEKREESKGERAV